MKPARLRVGVVGTGLNSEYHVRFAKAYPNAEIVGVADRDRARAEASAAAHGIPHAFESVSDLLAIPGLDVVHVVTPPATHAAIVRQVLEAGKHVLVEKPFALNSADAESLYQLAAARGVQICPMHNHMFDPCMRRVGSLVESGDFGRIVNVESHYGLNPNIPAFRGYPRPNALSWLYDLPGGVYQDFLPHPLYVMLDYVGAPREVSVMHRSTGVLPQHLPDEIRVLIGGEHALGSLTVSFAAQPYLHLLRLYGTKMMAEVDFNTMTAVVHRTGSLPKAAQRALYNLDESWQQTRSTISNVYQFLTGELKPYQGMKVLIHRFYDGIQRNTAPPVSKEQALTVVKTMDRIFEQLKYEPLSHERSVQRSVPGDAAKVLVTGGTGFVGKALVKRLVADGFAVRVLARKLARVEPLREIGVEVMWGDVADQASFGEAIAGCDIVIHLAAGTSGSTSDSESGTLEGTRNLLELCRQHRPRRLIYVSSCSVYGVADLKNQTRVHEGSPLERFPERRGTYSASKQQAESLVADFVSRGTLPTVILRPGAIFGPGCDLYSAMLGFGAGRTHVVIGRKGFVLPFTYIDNVVDAIVKCSEDPRAVGQTFNVVDPEPITKREYMDRVIRQVRPGAQVYYLPYAALYALTWLQEVAFDMMKRQPVLSRYRLRTSQKPVIFDGSRIIKQLEWQPPVSLADALYQLVGAETGRNLSTGQKPAGVGRHQAA